MKHPTGKESEIFDHNLTKKFELKHLLNFPAFFQSYEFLCIIGMDDLQH